MAIARMVRKTEPGEPGMHGRRAFDWASRSWFYLLLPVWLIAAWNLHRNFDWTSHPGMGEAIVLFDWCVFMPILHAVCFRRLPPRALAIRKLAILCGGIWMAGLVVPDDAEAALRALTPVRGIGIAILIAIEGLAIVAIFRVAFTAQPTVDELARQGIPPAIARLMIAEARFWRWLWNALRGR